MHNVSTTISTDELDRTDTTYQYHSRRYDKNSLLRSIGAHGIYTPLIAEDHGDSIRIVHGFRRYDCAEQLGLENLPVIFTEGSPMENLRSSLIDNRVMRDLNIYEQSRVMEIAGDLGAKETEVIEQILPLLNLHPHKNVYDDYRGFTRLPADLIEFFVEKDVPISRTRIFQRLSREGQEIAVALLETLSPGINVLEELLTSMYEISRRDVKPIREVYNNLEIESVLDESGQPHRALGEIRHRLYKQRFPTLAKANNEIRKLTDSLELHHCSAIHWDDKLETRGVNMTFHWDRVDDVEQSVGELKNDENRETLKKIFKII